MVALMVAGYLLTRPSDSYNPQQTASKIGFNHQQKYDEIHSGSGTGMLSSAAGTWKTETTKDFDEVSHLLEEAATKAGVTWEGAAAEAHGDSVRPLVSFVDDAKQVSTSVGSSTEMQVDNFASVRDTMPEPKKVTATDSLLEKGGAALLGYDTDLQQQEQEAMRRAQEAQRLYENYEGRSSNVTTSLPRYAEAPKTTYSGNGGTIASNQPSIDSGSTYSGSNVSSGSGVSPGSGSGGSGSGSGGYGNGPGAGGPGSGGGSGSGDGSDETDPAGSGSAGWAPPVTGGPAPVPAPGYGGGYGNVGTGPDGVVGGVYGPGGGSGGGGRTGGGRSGSVSGGRGGTGTGSGTGGRGNSLGSGGRSGSGTPGPTARPSTASASSASSSSAARGMAPMRGGQQQDGGEDEEHERKFMVDTDDAWADLNLPPTAPPVIGEDLEQPRRRGDEN